jgi:hypothetical protein
VVPEPSAAAPAAQAAAAPASAPLDALALQRLVEQLHEQALRTWAH